MQRLRTNLTRYHGVFAPNSPFRNSLQRVPGKSLIYKDLDYSRRYR